jgi:hypothetical protein
MSSVSLHLFALLLAGSLAAGVPLPALSATSLPSKAPAEAATLHIDVEKALKDILQSHEEIRRGLQAHDIPGLRKQLLALDEQLRQWQRTAHRVLIVGAWQSAELKQDARRLIGRIKSAEMLSTMSVSILTGYEFPAKKVPNSVVDTTGRLFNELEELSLQVAALNRRVG